MTRRTNTAMTEWARLVRWQRSVPYSDWAWKITTKKMKAFDKAWLKWHKTNSVSRLGGPYPPLLEDFA